MGSDQPESDVTTPAEPNESTPDASTPAPDNPAALVARLIEAGEWPDPALLEQIVAAGEAAIEPLLAYIRTYPSPKDYQKEIVLYNAVGLLGTIRSPGTIPDLLEVIRRYPADSGELAAEALGGFGAIALEPILELVRDPEVTGYCRRNAINAAKYAAGNEPALRARLADVLRPLLADALERTRESEEEDAEGTDEEAEPSEGWIVEDLDEGELSDDEEEGDYDDDEEEPSAVDESPDDDNLPDLEPYEELMFLIGDLADLADPQARDLINTAFREDLVDTFWVDKKSVDESYRKGGEPSHPRRDWLEDYRENYQERMERQNRPPAPMPRLYQSSLGRAYPQEPVEPEPPPPQVPIRNEGPKLGRNDPCWCGSGKKYKKCHWGKPGP